MFFRGVQRRRSTFGGSVDTTRWRSGRSTAWVTTTMASSPARNGALPQRGNSLYQVSVRDGLMPGSLNGTHFGRIKVDAKSLEIWKGFFYNGALFGFVMVDGLMIGFFEKKRFKRWRHRWIHKKYLKI